LASGSLRPGGLRRFLPPDPRTSEPYRLTPQLALRIAILGALALGVFAILFLRLWALQVLSGTTYLKEAQNNQVREVRIEAPRGVILDRHGKVLVGNVAGTAVRLWPTDLPKTWREQRKELRALARVLDVRVADILKGIEARKDDPLTPLVIKRGVHRDQVMFLSERQDAFPGVQIVDNHLRHYRYQSLAAQVLGYVGEISETQLKQLKGDGYTLGDTIGQAGVESTYDKYLRGRDGLSQLHVDSLGRPQSELEPSQLPRGGNAIRLTLDIGLQRAAERALQEGIGLAHADGKWAANGGAIVALDPRDGAVLAMASNPTYQPSVYVSRDSDKLKQLGLFDPAVAKAANYPTLNRALAGLYPPGSTFKPVTAIAAMQEHLVNPYDTLLCSPVYFSPEDKGHQPFKNWNPFTSQWMDLRTALAASCDTYFYQLGDRFFTLPQDRGHPLQAWASKFGFGAPTGIDVGPETGGLLPTPEWRQEHFTKEADPCCFEIDRLWKPGDSIQLAIGQKDIAVTPLQMARFYALVANGGRLVTPHVVEDVEQLGQNGRPTRVLRRFGAEPPSVVGVDAGALQAVKDGLFEATHASIGTSSGVFANFPVPISGKTGTAEKVVPLPGYPVGHQEDQAWWCGYGPSGSGDTPSIVVCAVIENGGHGGVAAAPAALRVFEQYFGRQANQITSHVSD
jgi:penicillin-binding protein 2